MRGRYERQEPKKGKKLLLILLAVLVVTGIAGAVGVAAFFDNMLDLVNRAEVVERPEATVDSALLGNFEETEPLSQETPEPNETTMEPTTVPTTLPYTPSGQEIINILVVGQAARDGEHYRMADTMILATVNKTTKDITLTSFLRDAYVDMPDYMGKQCGWGRINTVYHLGWTWGDTGGAMEMMNLCLKNNFGIEVDYNVEIDFNAFTKIIDILGGVRIDLTEAEVKYLQKETWQEVTVGENRLFGDAALAYARMRKAEGDGDSDIKRTARQRTLITALIRKLANKMAAEGFTALRDIANEILPMITTNMTNDQITTCIWELLPLLPELSIQTGTCPVETTYWGEIIDLSGTPSSVLKFDAGQNKRLMMAITEGTEE